MFLFFFKFIFHGQTLFLYWRSWQQLQNERIAGEIWFPTSSTSVALQWLMFSHSSLCFHDLQLSSPSTSLRGKLQSPDPGSNADMTAGDVSSQFANPPPSASVSVFVWWPFDTKRNPTWQVWMSSYRYMTLCYPHAASFPPTFSPLTT